MALSDPTVSCVSAICYTEPTQESVCFIHSWDVKDFSVDAEVFFSFRDYLDDGFGLYRVVRV